MKKIVSFLLVMLAAAGSFAQQTSSAKTDGRWLSKIYLQSGAGTVSRDGSLGEIGVQAVFHNKWIATVSHHSYTVKAKNTPYDYDPGWGYVFFIPYSNDESEVNLNSVQLTAGKYFSSGRATWFGVEAGISIVNGEKATFTRNPDTAPVDFIFGGDYPSNYNVTKERSTAIGGVVKADFNWAFASFMGAGVNVFADVNAIQSPVGMEIKLIIGKMNRGKK